MEIVKRITELIPFLAPYPFWVKLLVCAWTFVSAALLLSLVFVPHKKTPEKSVEELFHLDGQVISTNADSVTAAIIELIIGNSHENARTDSEGTFKLETVLPRKAATGLIRISAAGYHSYERNIDIDVGKSDLGTFILHPEKQVSETDKLNSENPVNEVDDVAFLNNAKYLINIVYDSIREPEAARLNRALVGAGFRTSTQVLSEFLDHFRYGQEDTASWIIEAVGKNDIVIYSDDPPTGPDILGILTTQLKVKPDIYWEDYLKVSLGHMTPNSAIVFIAKR